MIRDRYMRGRLYDVVLCAFGVFIVFGVFVGVCLLDAGLWIGLRAFCSTCLDSSVGRASD